MVRESVADYALIGLHETTTLLDSFSFLLANVATSVPP